MNTTLSTTLGRHEHPPESVATEHPRAVRRVGLLDRAALHLGVALITWGRRPLTVASHEQRARQVEQHRARMHREWAAERWQRLNLPRL